MTARLKKRVMNTSKSSTASETWYTLQASLHGRYVLGAVAVPFADVAGVHK